MEAAGLNKLHQSRAGQGNNPLLAGKAVRDRGSEAVVIREIKDFLSETNSFNSSEPVAN